MIPLFKVFMPEGLNDGLNKIIYSGTISYGPHAMEFERKLISYLRNPFVLTTSNNNHAMLIALAVAGVGAGDEVIASAMSCLASNQPVISVGGKIVWADIDPKHGALDPDDVRRRITAKTKAILNIIGAAILDILMR
jgi:perosamine synthetase